MSKNNKSRPSPGGKQAPRVPSGASTPKAAPKFYSGPTVRSSDKAAATPVKAPVVTTVAPTAPVKAKKRRGGCSIFSLITFVPFLVLFSLFSTVLCPPPNVKPSSFARIALNSLGIASDKDHSSIHQTLCYPSNLYHEHVLQPHVYPVLADVQSKIQAHPVYKEKLEPGYNLAKGTTLRVWNGPVKPVVNRIARGARKFYLINIEPRLPYLKAKFTEATAPATLRIKAQYNQHLAHHVKTAKKHACTTFKRLKATYRDVAGHPLTAMAGKHSQTAFRLSKEHAHKAYVFSKPHAINAWDFSAHHGRHTVFPRALQALEIAAENIVRGFRIAKSHAHKLYQAHAAEHVDPYLHNACAAIAPYQKLWNDKVYAPHLKPLIAAYLPEPPKADKSFWGYVSDWMPVAGTQAGQRVFSTEQKTVKKEQVKKEPVQQAPVKAKAPVKEKPKVKQPEPEFKTQVDPAVKPKDWETRKAAARAETKVVEEVTTPAQAASTATTTKSAAPEKDHHAEVVAALAELKRKVDFQAKAGYGRIQSDIIKEGERYIELLPEMAKIGLENLDREMKRMITGLDRLYSTSKTLTRGQVAESCQMSDKKVGVQHTNARTGIQKGREAAKQKAQPSIQAAQNDLDKLVGADYEALGKKMSIVDTITRQEWDAYKAIKQDVESWKAKYAELPDKPTTKPLKELSNKVQARVAEVLTEFDDQYEMFRANQNQLKKVALERISAREAVAKDEKEAPVRAGGAKRAQSAEDGRVSIQPIKEEGANARGGAPVIGKDKVQVEEALKKAERVSDEDKAKITGRPEL